MQNDKLAIGSSMGDTGPTELNEEVSDDNQTEYA
jgi:hypothetical protein